MVCDVVIAGAGPNGLMLACELRLAGVHPVVLERLSEPNPENRANGLVGQVVRMLDRRGLYQSLAGESGPPRTTPAFFFGAVPMDLHTLDDNPFHLLPVPQTRIERVLADRAAALGVEVRRGHELTGLSQQADAVTVEVVGPTGRYEISSRSWSGQTAHTARPANSPASNFPARLAMTSSPVSRKLPYPMSSSTRPPVG
jgi:2-polyprenyl-6-methoxyphenol hydroxylase-like FAD-dependent oxidoreductase